MKIEMAEALYKLGALPPEQLREVAAAYLSGGADTPALREMVGLDSSATWRDAEDVFERVLQQLGRALPTEREAAYTVATLVARDIVAGRVNPYEGAATIAFTSYRAAGEPADLQSFYYWADEWQDHPEYREACEADIVREAHAFLSSDAARTT